jgi:Xaa-Pro aminopeptidase
MKTIANRIASLHPCAEATTWASAYTNAAKAWAECQRGDWMLWIIGKQAGTPLSDKRKTLVLCACECAERALPYTTDERVKACIDTAKAWANGKATIDDLRAAKSAAAADADAADAAADAADAAADAAAADARTSTLAKCADIIRRHYPKPPKIA